MFHHHVQTGSVNPTKAVRSFLITRHAACSDDANRRPCVGGSHVWELRCAHNPLGISCAAASRLISGHCFESSLTGAIPSGFAVLPRSGSHGTGRMKVVSFIEPPQRDVIEKILDHCGLARPSAPRPPPANQPVDHSRADLDGPAELTCVDIDTFLATF